MPNKRILKRGDQRADGMIFYRKWSDGREYWVSPETFEDLVLKEARRQRKYHRDRKGDDRFLAYKRKKQQEYRNRKKA